MARAPRGRGRGQGRGHERGRGRCVVPSPPLSRSPSHASPGSELRGFKFFLPIHDRDAMERKRLPPKFAQLLDPMPPRVLKVREAGGGRRYWTVKVLFYGEGAMYLDRGCELFARARRLHQGHLLNFSFNGDDTLTVKVFDGTTCRRHYYIVARDDDESSNDGSSDA